ncbi:HNH endonuclease family protein [Alteromonadaceae bacterium BrNp21-10]|nr:HNH endonuclease family protein [Alteromonadaceae bacterium BrNp21-10]
MVIRVVLLLIFFASCLLPSHAGENVKLSRTGICHDNGSRYFPQIKHFQGFDSLEACQAAGGQIVNRNSRAPSVTASIISDSISVKTSDYNRKQWRHWIDEDNDCQNTRAEVLIRDAQQIDAYKTIRQCQVTAGRWYDVYSGTWFNQASTLDIDHVIPLSYAHQITTGQWSADKKREFANDPDNLLAVSAAQNRQKGAKGPTQWMPASAEYQCEYLKKWQYISQKYQLALLPQDVALIQSQLATSQCQFVATGNVLRAAN